MILIKPRDLSREQAKRHLAHAENTREFRLTELAHWMAASGGPIDEMDGSLASVEPLWRWVQTFPESDEANLIPAEWRTDESIGFGFIPKVKYRRRQYIAQALPSYILEVLRRLEPSTHFSLYNWGGKNHAHFNTLVYRADFAPTPKLNSLDMWAATGMFHGKRVSFEKFFSWFSTEFGDWTALARDDPRGASILAPLVTRPLSDFDSLRNPPEFVSEPRVAPDKSAPALAQLEEDEFMIAPRDYDPDDLAVGQPLDSEVVHHALLEMDASLGGGGTITEPAVWLSAAHADLALGSVAGATIFIADGAVRGVGFEIGEITEKEWRTLSKQMRALAKSLGVHFAPDQDESWKANQ